MLFIAIIAAIVASAINAGSSVLERMATGTPSADRLFSKSFVVSVTTHKKFLIGIGLELLGFAVQALALANAPLSIIQPLMTANLIFLLLFVWRITHVRLGWREWGAVGAMVAGLSALFPIARPRSGTLQYALLPWIITGIIAIAGVVGCLALVFWARSTRLRSFAGGLAAAISFAMSACLTKLALHQLLTSGAATILTSWPLYALIVTGICSVFLMQTAYGAGPLAYSEPTIEIAKPAFSVIIGIVIFSEQLNHGPLAIVGETAAILVLALGIIGLGSSDKIHKAGKRGL